VLVIRIFSVRIPPFTRVLNDKLNPVSPAVALFFIAWIGAPAMGVVPVSPFVDSPSHIYDATRENTYRYLLSRL
jgi:hypothetical protein